MQAVYVDHAATSPTHPKVAEAMLPFLTEHFGNPSSIHGFGRKTRHVVDEARQTIAKSIGAAVNEIIFTSGGTESDNTAIIGAALANQHKGKHIITTAVEHHAVLHTCQFLEGIGFEVTYLPVDETGQISLQTLGKSLKDETILVSVMYGNNEVGTLQPIKEIGAFLKEKDIYFHTDAVQAYGMVELDVKELNVNLLSVSAHKINGPKGIGFLYVKEGTKILPLQHGGEQERKRRAGTENVAGIVGFEKAVQIMLETKAERQKKYQSFRNHMINVFKNEQINFRVNGHSTEYLPHILNVSFSGTNVESMLVNLDLAGIAVSSGSACTAGSVDPSHVLMAMFGESERVYSSLRFSFGLGNTEEDIQKAAQETVKIVKRLTKQ
ncbi:cysteine desulfurase family protein [Bacillus taeanensis]|uniref:Cysteine desulfurase NifS n=1 Tax=Bacillus taeanensis TaxID=273032 RepID=A0A366Y2K5_9BACI|nr:cysteine desulfurase family protein [Bacillus taeanensis]RBW70441.1 cysteine desulfurase NifS [Bacillus taeanensis]